jgi:hypothetical protein
MAKILANICRNFYRCGSQLLGSILLRNKGNFGALASLSIYQGFLDLVQ